MQTTIQFGANSTIQEWTNFKGILTQVKSQQKPLVKNESGVESLINHLTKQLQGGSVIKL